ncbi:MAG TPA: sulfatase-like hydrolase/transferase [Chitinophagales bacterium]|nr:sulfatase-like hydrolase/transferase [Chitinophagales bacterium]
MSKPRNIILIVADSLRYDSVYGAGETQSVYTPYLNNNAVQFAQARSSGCWTLPATASLFTGLMPHQHGATSQTRNVNPNVPTLAQRLKAAGYNTLQITANVATTDIFGLHRGFDEIRRIWQLVPAKFNRLQQLLVMVGKPRCHCQ